MYSHPNREWGVAKVCIGIRSLEILRHPLKYAQPGWHQKSLGEIFQLEKNMF